MPARQCSFVMFSANVGSTCANAPRVCVCRECGSLLILNCVLAVISASIVSRVMVCVTRKSPAVLGERIRTGVNGRPNPAGGRAGAGPHAAGGRGAPRAPRDASPLIGTLIGILNPVNPGQICNE